MFARLVAAQKESTPGGRSIALEILARLETQENLGACAPASGVSLLNAWRVPAPPRDPRYAQFGGKAFGFWTQTAWVFHSCAQKVLGPFVYGETLRDFASVLSCMGLSSAAVVASSDRSPESMVAEMEKQLSLGNGVIANYDRSKVHQSSVGGGHFSPLGGSIDGYFLVLDVARFKFRPAFIPHADLVAGMQSVDSQSGKPRGFVAVKWVASSSS